MLQVGEKYFMKTVTHYYLGRVVKCTPTHVELNSVSEVYETGPLTDFFVKGVVKSHEPVPNGWFVPLAGTCFTKYAPKLPNEK